MNIYELKQNRLKDHLNGNNVRRFDAILSAAIDANIRCDSKGRIISWNRPAEKIFGWSVDEVVGKSIEIIIPETHRRSHQEGFARFLKTSQARIINKLVEIEGLHKSGRIFPIELTVTSLLLGEEHEFIAFLRDISKRKKIESEKLIYEQIFLDAHEAVFITNVDKVITKINPSFTEITGYNHEDVVGKNAHFLASTKQDELFYEKQWAAVSSQGFWQGEVWNKKKSNEFKRDVNDFCSQNRQARFSLRIYFFGNYRIETRPRTARNSC